MLKWIIVIVLIAAGVWAYLNLDLSGMKNEAQDNTMNAIKNEKTIKVFFDADKQNKQTDKIFTTDTCPPTPNTHTTHRTTAPHMRSISFFCPS